MSCRRQPAALGMQLRAPVTGRGRSVSCMREAEGSAHGLSTQRPCLWSWMELAPVGRADEGAQRGRGRAGMASEGIITMLTQYLQLKLGYETADQARALLRLCLPPDLFALPTVLQHGRAPGQSCQHCSSMAPRQRRPGAHTAYRHERGGLGGGRAGEAVRGRGRRGAGDQHAAAAQPARLARQSPAAVARCGPGGRAQSPSLARRTHV